MPEERKLVTILFADVTGSTALGESLDPEDVRALMGRYYEHARDIVGAYGGTIEKFIGDAVMAVFGLTQAHGDDAERALAAALALREAIARDEVLGESFKLRFGVNTGEVVATSDLSRGDFLITGDAVNVAARLQQHANPDEIIASERTVDAAQTSFLFEEPRLIEAKGKRLPLRVFPLIGPRPTREVSRPPLVGRKQDLMQLALLKERVLEEERPQLVSIVAPAGTGKTRLLEEFLKRLDPDEDFQVAMVRCLPYGQTLTYWPLQGLLEGMMQGEKIAKAQIMRIFTDVSYNTSDASRLADLILATLGIESDSHAQANTDREAIFNVWRLLIEAFSQLAPRVLVFEDLHWASESMLDLVEHIINVRTHARMLLIVLSRPELLDRRPAWGGGRQNFTSIALQPLTAKQTQDLIQQLAKTLPDNLRQQVVERSGGNPFFALELIRGLIERGKTGTHVSLDALPDTVHAAVLARLDMLSKTERTLLQVASVASRSFRVRMLEAIMTDATPQDISSALDDLLQRDILAPTEGDGYTFRHILFRDVAYGTLSRAERMRLHSSIASWLEANAPHDSYAAVIAYHYREAVQLAKQSAVPKKLPHETERAVYYLTRAGEVASHASAINEARTYFQQALEIAPESEHMHLYELLGDSGTRGDITADAYKKAIVCWRNSGGSDALMGTRLLRKLLIVYTRGSVSERPTREQVDELRTEANQLAERAGNEDEQWRIRILDAFYNNRYVPAAENTQEDLERMNAVGLAAAAYFEQRQDWSAFSESLDSCAVLAFRFHRMNSIIELAQRRLAVQELSAYERGDATNMMGAAYFLLGDYAQSIAVIKNALLNQRPDDAPIYLETGPSNAMFAAYFNGQWDDVMFIAPFLKEVWEQVLDDLGALMTMMSGYMALLFVAASREDRPTSDASNAALEHFIQRLGNAEGNEKFALETFHAVLKAHQEDDVSYLSDTLAIDKLAEDIAPLWMMFLSEHGFVTPDSVEAAVIRQEIDLKRFIVPAYEIARALKSDDNEQLSEAIDGAENAQLIVHAARMRIVLAQRTGDRSQLDRAREVLERIQDRRFLRRLAEVEGVIK